MIFILSFQISNWYAELMHVIVATQPEKQLFCSKKKFESLKFILMKWIFSLFLMRHLFWFTWQHSRISWTCGMGNKQYKFRQNIKWFGLKNCGIDKMRLKCLLHPLLSMGLPFRFPSQKFCFYFWLRNWGINHRQQLHLWSFQVVWYCFSLYRIVLSECWTDF